MLSSYCASKSRVQANLLTVGLTTAFFSTGPRLWPPRQGQVHSVQKNIQVQLWLSLCVKTQMEIDRLEPHSMNYSIDVFFVGRFQPNKCLTEWHAVRVLGCNTAWSPNHHPYLLILVFWVLNFIQDSIKKSSKVKLDLLKPADTSELQWVFEKQPIFVCMTWIPVFLSVLIVLLPTLYPSLLSLYSS